MKALKKVAFTIHYYIKMMAWQTLFLLCCLLNCVESSASTLVSKYKYNNSFRLTRSTRTRVQQLLKKYKEQQLGNTHFENRSQHLTELPFLSTDLDKWLKLSNWDRLHAAFWDLQAYWKMLERKRKQLEREQNEQIVVDVAQTTLLRNMRHIQLDLRDLMSQVSNQMRLIRSSWIRPMTAAAHLNPRRSTRTVWDDRVEGYIILRDLNLYLTKLARDFLLLASKTQI
ncbi:uncharacterized protein LOC121654343 [Melanotaenia boesemani]|uniref:uncharacterized protein LOC121654343 n=1 Tax=Melanotaenia boesemani TaxID=1250792 RepID=UPI001C052049|nr:uncharacterized protein LOC121654343 [Melanotaenia boesemani]